MCLNYKQAILAGVISEAVIFLLISAMMFTPLWGTEVQKYINMLVGAVVAYLVAYYFYFKKKPKDAVKEGLLLGVVFVAVSVIIETPVMAFGFAKDMGLAWFAQWHLLASYLLGMVACMVAATMKKK